tara:strand:+ start:1027 stop:1167 length:141 start_codon:yes stop_codon:yes gene_type:complete
MPRSNEKIKKINRLAKKLKMSLYGKGYCCDLGKRDRLMEKIIELSE